eukprot:6198434-Pleurochrysis_carterae.AAC.1
MKLLTLCCFGILALHAPHQLHACSFVVANFNLTDHPAWGTPGEKAGANWYNRFRGPDATHSIMAHGWSFVHNLLSMTGAFTLQPFVSSDGMVVCLFNGEIYNYRTLAKHLVGDEEAFSSDGQALLPAYMRWGADMVTHLQGEFAVVVLDFAQQTILISTDVFSTKPL